MSQPIQRIPLRWESPPTWGEYAEGYARAVRLVVAELRTTLKPDHGGLPEFQPLGFPLLFLARHCLEISIKGALLNASTLSGEPTPDVAKLRHDLGKAWSKCKAVLTKGSVPRPTVFRAIDDLVDWLSDLDEDSMVFRYATDKKGRYRGGDSVSLEEFVQKFQAAYRLLDSIHSHLRTALDYEGLEES